RENDISRVLRQCCSSGKQQRAESDSPIQIFPLLAISLRPDTSLFESREQFGKRADLRKLRSDQLLCRAASIHDLTILVSRPSDFPQSLASNSPAFPAMVPIALAYRRPHPCESRCLPSRSARPSR